MLALKALEKGIDLRVEQDISVPRYVYGDESEQVIANALKYLVDNFELEAIANLTQT
ncbi:MAG: hypothetical protein V7L26_28425 [Nostoc sp.]